MYHRVLVPLDGSPRAEQAIPVAERVCRASSGALELLHVIALPPAGRCHAPGTNGSGPLAPPAPSWTPDTLERHQQYAEDYLAGVITRYHVSDRATVRVMPSTSVASAILEEALTTGADLLVLCRYGQTGPSRWTLGGIAAKVMRHATAPVLLLPEGGRTARLVEPGLAGPLRALVPLDGSALAERALAPATALVTALADPAPAILHLVRVLEAHDLLGPDRWTHLGATNGESRDWALRETKAYLSAVAHELEQYWTGTSPFAVTWSAVAGSAASSFEADVAEAILRTAEVGEDAEGAEPAGRCDLLALYSHGHGGTQPWGMGSVTERLVQVTALPVLVVHLRNEGPAHEEWTPHATTNSQQES